MPWKAFVKNTCSLASDPDRVKQDVGLVKLGHLKVPEADCDEQQGLRTPSVIFFYSFHECSEITWTFRSPGSGQIERKRVEQ